VFENRVLRRILRQKRDEVTGERRRLDNEELRDLYSSTSTRIIKIIKSRRMRLAGHVTRAGGEEKRVYVIGGKAREKDQDVGGWMDLGVVGWSDVDWIGLAQDRNRWRALVNSVLNLRVP
jgi:hypothetical protein